LDRSFLFRVTIAISYGIVGMIRAEDKTMDRESHGILREALHAYIDLMGKEAYFDAHDALEKAWYPLRKEKTPLGNLLRGLINGAVAFEHLKRAKPGAEERAKKIMGSFDRYAALCDKDIPEADLFAKACEKVTDLKVENGKVFDVLVS